MPFFKTTYNILIKQDEDELFNDNWMDSDKLILPPKIEWDYSREMQIEDVDIWEVIYEQTNGFGVYASWLPYAEFYLITSGNTNHLRMINGVPYGDRIWETYYGKGADKKVQSRMRELNIPFSLNKKWVEPEKVWLYQG